MEVTSPCEDMLKIFMFPYLVGTWLFENWSMQSMISKQRSTKQKSTQFLIIALLWDSKDLGMIDVFLGS